MTTSGWLQWSQQRAFALLLSFFCRDSHVYVQMHTAILPADRFAVAQDRDEHVELSRYTFRPRTVRNVDAEPCFVPCRAIASQEQC